MSCIAASAAVCWCLVVGLLDCCSACCVGGALCCCHAALLHAPVWPGVVWCGAVVAIAVRVLCWQWLAYSVPCLASSFPTFVPLHLLTPAIGGKPSSPFRALPRILCRVSAAARWRRLLFPCLVGRSTELMCPRAGCCRRWRLLPAGMTVWHLFSFLRPAPILSPFSFRVGVGSLPVHCLLVAGPLTA